MVEHFVCHSEVVLDWLVQYVKQTRNFKERVSFGGFIEKDREERAWTVKKTKELRANWPMRCTHILPEHAPVSASRGQNLALVRVSVASATILMTLMTLVNMSFHNHPIPAIPTTIEVGF